MKRPGILKIIARYSGCGFGGVSGGTQSLGWQMPKRVRDNTAVAALTDAEGAGRLRLVLPAVVFRFTYCEAFETPL
jgi:hypothetical protein